MKAMDSTLIAVLVGGIVTVCVSGVLPFVMLLQNNRNSAAVIAAANARADLLQWRADKVAIDLAKNNRLNAAIAADQSKITNDKVDGVHALVNSRMTIVQQALLESLKSQRAMMLDGIAAEKSNGREASSETVGAVMTVSSKIGELETDIADSLRLAAIAENKIG